MVDVLGRVNGVGGVDVVGRVDVVGNVDVEGRVDVVERVDVVGRVGDFIGRVALWDRFLSCEVLQ